MSIPAKAEPGNEESRGLKTRLKGFLCKHFGGIDIDDIFISRHVDDDGFEYLRVRVILAGTGQRIDPHLSIDVIESVRPLLDGFGEDGFPVISYIDKVDVEEAGVAAFA